MARGSDFAASPLRRGRLASYLVLMVVLAAVFAAKPASAATSQVIEAENMSGDGSVYSDETASNDKARVLKRNGRFHDGFNGPVDTVLVRARGRQCQGSPRMVVKVDGQTVISSSVRNNGWDAYTADATFASGAHDVKIAFNNDLRAGDCNRNLRVDKVKLVSNTDSNTEVKPPPNPSPTATCQQSLQALVNAAARGSVVSAPGGCFYRETVTISKPLTLRFGAGAGMLGSDRWTGWTRRDDYWVSSNAVPNFSNFHGQCQDGSGNECLWPEMVFVNGTPLRQVADNSVPAPGTFSLDSSRHVRIGNDPSDKAVEVTVREYAVKVASNDVNIEGYSAGDKFTVQRYASDSQSEAALRSAGNDRVRVSKVRVNQNHGSGVSLKDGSGLSVSASALSHNGHLGMHSSNASLMVSGTEIDHNTEGPYAVGWEGGGTKMANMRSVLVNGSDIHDNRGNGLWCDVGCTNVEYQNNRIHHNTRFGINFEISSGANIHDNVVYENGSEDRGWAMQAGIMSSSSRDVEIHHNLVAWNPDGISAISQNRGTKTIGDHPAEVVTDVHVHDNTIVMPAPIGEPHEYGLSYLDDWAGSVLGNTASDNRGYGNRYWYPVSEDSRVRYAYDEGRYNTLAGFNKSYGEEGATYLTKAERDTLLTRNGVPLSPEPR